MILQRTLLNMIVLRNLLYNNNNNNNNIILRSWLSHTPNWCMRLSCLWDMRPPSCNVFIAKVYKNVHTQEIIINCNH
jgi:hypothetical protein